MSRGQTIAAGFALLYLALLATVAVLFAYVGEQWWVSGVGLYLPRALLAVPLPATVIALVAAGLRRLIWTQALASALLVFPLMGFAVHFPLFRASALPALRVLSYNVNSTTGGVGAIVEEIDRHSPDVVLLQEVASTDALADLLRARYSTVEISGQFMFASRYPLLSTREPPRIPYEGRLRSPRFVQQVLDTPLGHIVFYNVHPLSPRETLYTLRGQGLRRVPPARR